MNIEQQVTNLSISKRLKDLNVKQDSLFVWEYFDDRCYGVKFIPYALAKPLPLECEQYSAFTSSELIDILTHMVDTKINEPFNNFRLWITKSFIVEGLELDKRFIYIINYKCDSTELAGENAWLQRQLTSNIFAENLANALALMLIYLLENKLMEVNK